jgi:hypothetical protein
MPDAACGLQAKSLDPLQQGSAKDSGHQQLVSRMDAAEVINGSTLVGMVGLHQAAVGPLDGLA